jgi:hypothetical protein
MGPLFNSLNSVGWCYAMLGEYTQRLTYCRQALTVHRQLGDRYGEADTWPSLGFAHHRPQPPRRHPGRRRVSRTRIP